MPYPSQISSESVLRQAVRMIEADGAENLSVNRLAAALDVKAPSLYRYYRNKTALSRAVNQDTLERLFDAIEPVLQDDVTVTEKLMRVAVCYRDFAIDNAATYGLLFTNVIDGLRPDNEQSVRLVQPYQKLLGQLCGEAHAFNATRGFLAILHGFVMLELSGQFRRDGDVETAFHRSVRAYLAGWHDDDVPIIP